MSRVPGVGCVLHSGWPRGAVRGAEWTYSALVPSGSQHVICTDCGTPREAELAQAEVESRDPCSVCGSTAITVHLHVADSAVATDSVVSLGLTPGEQGRDWRRRWQEVQRDVVELSAPQTGEFSADGIHAAAHRLHAFFIHTYHLKDALKADTAHGVRPAVIEKAITNDPDLALLADLANLDKHFQLSKTTRSGDVPVIGPVQGVSSGSGGGRWRLHMPITHAGRVLDGVQVAGAAVAAWQRQLQGWGLI